MPLVVSAPLIQPAPMPRTIGKAAAQQHCRHAVPSVSTALFMTMIMTPEIAAAMEPTDRSMPPAVMTKVAPTAMMPMKAERVRRLVRLPSLMKARIQQEPDDAEDQQREAPDPGS